MGLRGPARPLSPGLMAHMSVSNPLSPGLMAQMGPLSLLSLGLGFYVFEILRCYVFEISRFFEILCF